MCEIWKSCLNTIMKLIASFAPIFVELQLFSYIWDYFMLNLI
jgi:hypothetical protein